MRKRRRLFLTADQVAKLAEAAESRQEGARALIVLLAYAGLRWGEAVALRWENVDIARRRILVKESATEISGRLEWGTPKTHEVRTVIVPQFVIEGLGDPGEGFVFTAPRGGPLRHSNFTKGIWLPAVKDAESVPEGLLIHDLRDTAASLAISAGASIKAVQRMLGHASAAMTLDTYGSLFDEDLEDLADRMEPDTDPARTTTSSGSRDERRFGSSALGWWSRTTARDRVDCERPQGATEAPRGFPGRLPPRSHPATVAAPAPAGSPAGSSHPG